MPKSKTRPVVAALERREPAPQNPGSAHGPQWLTLVRTANYLGLSTMTITRYATEEAYAHLNFPKPSMIVDRCYWNVTDIDNWMRSRVGAVSTRKPKTKSAA